MVQGYHALESLRRVRPTGTEAGRAPASQSRRASSSFVKFNTKKPFPPGQLAGASMILIFFWDAGRPFSNDNAGLGWPNGRSGREWGKDIVRPGIPERTQAA